MHVGYNDDYDDDGDDEDDDYTMLMTSRFLCTLYMSI